MSCIPLQADDALDYLDDHLKIEGESRNFSTVKPCKKNVSLIHLLKKKCQKMENVMNEEGGSFWWIILIEWILPVFSPLPVNFLEY